jgi:ribosomal protein L31
MNKTEQLKKDYFDHGYKLVKEKNGILFFETEKDYNIKHNIYHKTHPIFTDKSRGTRSRVITQNICGWCRVNLEDDTCPKCHRKYNIVTKKPHYNT